MATRQFCILTIPVRIWSLPHMNYNNTKTKGNIAETFVLYKLSEKGYSVSIPFGENCPYDLIAESPNGKLYRIQVRKCSWKNNVLEVPVRIISKNYTRTLDFNRIEMFIVSNEKNLYVIPIKEIKDCKASFSLRKTKPKNNQKKKIKMAKDYLEAYHLMP